MKIDVTTDRVSTFGFAGDMKNKWQGKFLYVGEDQCLSRLFVTRT